MQYIRSRYNQIGLVNSIRAHMLAREQRLMDMQVRAESMRAILVRLDAARLEAKARREMSPELS